MNAEKKLKKDEELWIKIRDLIRSVTKHQIIKMKKDIKINFYSDDQVPLNQKSVYNKYYLKT